MCGQNPKVTKHFTDIKFFSGDDTSVTDFTSRGNLKSYKSLKKWGETHFTSPLLPASSPRHPLVATSTEGVEPKGSATEPLLSFSPLILPCCSPQPDKALRGPEGNACNISSCNWTPPKRKKVVLQSYSFEWWNRANKAPPEVTPSISLVQQRIHSALQEDDVSLTCYLNPPEATSQSAWESPCPTEIT